MEMGERLGPRSASRYLLSVQDHDSDVGDPVYFVSDKNYSLRFFTVCVIVSVSLDPLEQPFARAKLVMPFEHCSSAHLFSQFYARFHAPDWERDAAGHSPAQRATALAETT